MGQGCSTEGVDVQEQGNWKGGSGTLTSPGHPHAKTLNYFVDPDLTFQDTLHKKAYHEAMGCSQTYCNGALMDSLPPGGRRSKEHVAKDAKLFLEEYFASRKKREPSAERRRLQTVLSCIERTGRYDMTYDELEFGVRTAWRNSPRCIGRIQWSNLKLLDARHVKTASQMRDVLLEHMKTGTNGGNIVSTITVFPARTDGQHDFRVWNPQLIRYAGYKQPDGSIVGDPVSVELTNVCTKLGWKAPGGMFDVLPLVLQANGEDPEMFEIPKELIMEVPIEHPDYPSFAELGLRWYALPAVSCLLLDCGGLEFTAAPFNGWYMLTEIAARDFCDTQRYNLLPKAGVTIIDHHSVSESFVQHAHKEQRTRGGCPADWVWIVPPVSGGICPVFHLEMINYKLKPSFEYQPDPWTIHKWKNGEHVESANRLTLKHVAWTIRAAMGLMMTVMAKRVKCDVIYATETGRSERYAEILGKLFSQRFCVRVLCMEDYSTRDLCHTDVVLVVTSTFGSGDAPDNGAEFLNGLSDMKESLSAEVRFAVFALGSSGYPNFCNFGKRMDAMLASLGAQRIMSVTLGDELHGQEKAFVTWQKQVYQSTCDLYKLTDTGTESVISAPSWSPNTYRAVTTVQCQPDICEVLSRIHRRKVYPCIASHQPLQLQSPASDRQTVLVRLGMDGNDQEMKYEPGDHLAIFPANSSEMVEGVLSHVEAFPGPDDVINVEVLQEMPGGQMWSTDKRLPAVSLRTALTHFLDISRPPSVEFLEQILNLMGKKDRKLQRLVEHADKYQEWKTKTCPNLLELLNGVPSLKIPASLLLTQLPLLDKRLYSISSSPDKYPGQIHLTVSARTYTAADGKGPLKLGVCSNWLKSVKRGDIVPCYVRNSRIFHLPSDPMVPIIMIGPGCGIAPFRSFWQQREFDLNNSSISSDCGHMTLYFGCHNSCHDDIYRNEIEAAKKSGGLNWVFTAYSRQKPKRHVQDLLLKNAKEVFRVLATEGGYIYVCGGVSMAADVAKTLQQILAKKSGKAAKGTRVSVEDLKAQGRYREDIFGLREITET